MVKKHVHHFNRGLVIGAEILGVIALVLFSAWLFLIIRLSQGPMNVDFLTTHIEKALNEQPGGFTFDAGSTLLTWGGISQPFEFEMQDVQIFRSDKTPVLSVKKIGAHLSKKHIVFGRFVPRTIKIYGMALRIVRGEDGRFTLNINSPQSLPAPEQSASPVRQIDLLQNLLLQMKEGNQANLLGSLEQVAITDTSLLYEDKILAVNWRSTNSDVTFTRGAGGLIVDAITNVKQGETRKETAYLRGSFYYSWQTFKPNGVIYFTRLNPALIAQQSEKLKDFSGVDMPLKGSLSFEMNEDFILQRGRFVLGASAGLLNLLNLYETPLPVEKIYAQGQFDLVRQKASLEQLRMEMEGITLSAEATLAKQESGDHLLTLSGLLENTPIDKLGAYWPEKLAPAPQSWVTQHLSAGTAARATLELALTAPGGDYQNISVQKVGGEIDFSGITVDYFPPLMPVKDVAGKAVYDHQSFNLDISGGMLGDMKLSAAKIAITDIDKQDETTHAHIQIDTGLQGPLKTALTVLDSEPLRYPKELGLTTEGLRGQAAVDVSFAFPLYKELGVEEVKVSAKAKLKDTFFKDAVAGYALSGGPMDLALKDSSLTLKGEGLLGDMPVTFSWLKNFSAKAEISQKVEAKLPLTAAALQKFGVPEDIAVSGTVPADITYTVTPKQSTLLFKGGLGPAGFTLPVLGYNKPEGMAGSLSLIAHLKKDKLTRLSGLKLATDTAQIEGEMNFTTDGSTVQSADFSLLRLGETDIALTADKNDTEGYRLKITGRQFDASRIISPENPAEKKSLPKPATPLTLSMAVDKLLTGKDKHISNIRLFMRRDGMSRIDQLQIDGSSGGKPLQLRYMPVPKGHTLQFEADNAGTALSALGITNGMRGGKIVLTGKPNPQGGPRDLIGRVAVADFTLVNVPILGRLLNAMSLPGIFELLNGKGIAFKKMRADFWWTEKDPTPESSEISRVIHIKEGQTSGASLGLTFEGKIDDWNDTIDLNGTIIPVSDLNKLVGSIPLVGDILTGGGKGVFAATYTVKGPMEQPNVLVNPLSVLAPGIFRKLFFEQ